MRNSALKILKEGLTGNKGWKPVWRDPNPKPEYDVVIVGGGGHGLAAAYYLAKEYGITNVTGFALNGSRKKVNPHGGNPLTEKLK